MFFYREPLTHAEMGPEIGGAGVFATRVFFITNRNELRRGEGIIGFGSELHQNGPHWLRVGRATVDITADEAKTRLYADDDEINLTDFVVYPEVVRSAPEHHHLGGNRLFADLRRNLRDERKDLILYVHGYDTTFKEALWSAARIQLRYNRVLENLLDDDASAPFLARRPSGFETLVLSWPSDGQRLDHWRDRHAALQSSRALGRALLKARDFVERNHQNALADVFGRSASHAEVLRAATAREIACRGQIHVITEGAGSLALRLGFQDFLADPSNAGGPPRLLGQVFMTGADEDPDTFEHNHKLRRLPEVASRVTCYYNPDDLFTGTGRLSKHPPKRLGGTRPARRVDRANVDIVNVGAVVDPVRDGYRHCYARTNEIVARDMVLSMCGARDQGRPHRQQLDHSGHLLLVR